MSTILKALKRLDEQRRADAAPRTLEEQVLAGSSGRSGDPAARPNKGWFAAIGGAGLSLLAGIAWFALREPPQSARPAPPPVAAQPAELQDAIAQAPLGSLPQHDAAVSGTELDAGVRDALQVRSARSDSTLTGGAVSRRPAAGNQPEPGIGLEPELVAADAARNRAARIGAAEEAPAPFVAEPAREPVRAATPAPVAPAREPEPTPSPVPTVAQADPAPRPAAALSIEPPVATAEPEPRPDVAILPVLPEVWVERTQWHPTPAKRSALVRVGAAGEPRELHEGDSLEGVLVEEIRPSAVLFRYEGEEFKRGIGGS